MDITFLEKRHPTLGKTILSKDTKTEIPYSKDNFFFAVQAVD
jgi:hypothetical protein